MMAFVGITGYFLSRPIAEVQWQEKAIFSSFLFGAIACFAFSWIFHTVFCHSNNVAKLFNKYCCIPCHLLNYIYGDFISEIHPSVSSHFRLDYCGISILIVCSFIPWLYYCFYCRMVEKICYLVLIFILGTACTCFSLLDRFQSPKYRPIRAGELKIASLYLPKIVAMSIVQSPLNFRDSGVIQPLSFMR